MRAIKIAFVLAVVSTAAQAQTIQRIEITEFGIYQTKIEKKVAAPGTAAGLSNIVTDIKHVKTTATIPARIGANFGFRFRIIGRPNGERVTIRKITLIPQPGIRNPKTGNTTVRNEYSFERKIGETAFTNYKFEESWEVAPGTWTFELWAGNRKLASKSFNLVKP
jgi:hypothetical protein